MIPGAYNNNLQIVQAPGYVVIINEMVHNARIIPTDGRPHTKLRQWTGDSRGRWEGDTLVVETINFRRETSLQGSTADTRLVERFTRVDADTIRYEFTVSDPNSYIRPWSAMVPLSRTQGPLFEYACHEGNYALPNILAGARSRSSRRRSPSLSRQRPGERYPPRLVAATKIVDCITAVMAERPAVAVPGARLGATRGEAIPRRGGSG